MLQEWCQVLHVITNYFMVTSYLWMFCEGLHLHIALVVVSIYISNGNVVQVFVKDEVAMRWFVILGWGGSLAIVLVYAVVRFFTPGATERYLHAALFTMYD
ncbi:hypothetical protein HF086_004454 [Spodoptera exigua]|uniref:G-protein coupled receptors family 2 profile 2 domain-containing protein n=1 Tax=Spodoptera exigua TaxID=7107 RepID=A0A922M5X9_SPOEX|nr:hypothetical protein HF086_004454 [Spodoptera exigua]